VVVLRRVRSGDDDCTLGRRSSLIKSTNPWRNMAEPPMRKPDRTKLPSRARQCANVTAQSSGWQIAKVSLKLERDEVGGTHRSAKPRPRRPRCSTTLGPKSDGVTASAVAPQRSCDGTTVAPQRRCDGPTERCNTVSAGAVETGAYR
jgi:hypothetical protein